MANTHSLEFNGTTSTANTSATVDLSATNACTVEMWVKWLVYDTTNADMLFEMSANYNLQTDSFAVATVGTLAGDPIEVTLKGNAGYNNARYNVANTGLDDGGWHHMAFTFDTTQAGTSAGEVAMYIDGTLQSKDTAVTSSNNSNNFGNRTVYFGARGAASLFSNIRIDDVRIWNDVRTQGEISGNMSTELNGNETGLVYYWKLNNAATEAVAGNTMTLSNTSYSSDVPFVGGVRTVASARTNASARTVATARTNASARTVVS